MNQILEFIHISLKISKYVCFIWGRWNKIRPNREKLMPNKINIYFLQNRVSNPTDINAKATRQNKPIAARIYRTIRFKIFCHRLDRSWKVYKYPRRNIGHILWIIKEYLELWVDSWKESVLISYVMRAILKIHKPIEHAVRSPQHWFYITHRSGSAMPIHRIGPIFSCGYL